MFEPYRAAISWAYYWIKFRPENVAELISSGPATHEISTSLRQAEDGFANTSMYDAIAENTQTVKRLVSKLESRGCNVYFYELPYPGDLNTSHFAVTGRTLMHDYHVPELR